MASEARQKYIKLPCNVCDDHPRLRGVKTGLVRVGDKWRRCPICQFDGIILVPDCKDKVVVIGTKEAAK